MATTAFATLFVDPDANPVCNLSEFGEFGLRRLLSFERGRQLHVELVDIGLRGGKLPGQGVANRPHFKYFSRDLRDIPLQQARTILSLGQICFQTGHRGYRSLIGHRLAQAGPILQRRSQAQPNAEQPQGYQARGPTGHTALARLPPGGDLALQPPRDLPGIFIETREPEQLGLRLMRQGPEIGR